MSTVARPTPVPAPSSEVRASDAERENTVARLHHALGEGRLDLAETELRVAAAYDAQFRSELPPLLADLPGSAGAAEAARSAAPAWSAVWTSAVWRARAALWGTGEAPPTAAQCRTAAVLTLLALVWMTLCAVLGAALVGS